MFKYLITISLLFACHLLMYTMDDNSQYNTDLSSSESYDRKTESTLEAEDRAFLNMLNKHVSKLHIKYIKPLADCFENSEIIWAAPLCKIMKLNISVLHFPMLMSLLDECIEIIGERQIVFSQDIQGELSSEANTTLLQSIIDRKNVHKHIMKKQYTDIELITMLNMIDYLEIVWLRQPLLNKLLFFLIALSKNKQCKHRNNCIQSLKLSYHESLKRLLLEYYFEAKIKETQLGKGLWQVLAEINLYKKYNLEEIFDKLYGSNNSGCVIL